MIIAERRVRSFDFNPVTLMKGRWLATSVPYIRELKQQAFLLSRRPTGTKLSADAAYLNTSCGRGDRQGGLQAAFYLRVGLSELRSCFIKGMASSTEQIVSKSL